MGKRVHWAREFAVWFGAFFATFMLARYILDFIEVSRVIVAMFAGWVAAALATRHLTKERDDGRC